MEEVDVGDVLKSAGAFLSVDRLEKYIVDAHPRGREVDVLDAKQRPNAWLE